MTKKASETETIDPSERIREWLRALKNRTSGAPDVIGGMLEGPPALNAPPSQIQEWMLDGRAKRVGAEAVRSGVKTGAETVSMQIRVLKSQSDLLKTASFIEGRPASAILRQLLEEYFIRKCADPDPRERVLWVKTLLAKWDLEEKE